MLSDALTMSPGDAEAALQLEASIDEGADPARVAESFESSALLVDSDGEETPEGREVKKALLYRAARIFDGTLRDRERAEKVYSAIVELDPSDDLAQSALEDVRKALGKYAEIVESLMARSEEAAPGNDRARIFAEIGRICATELEDPEQGILAYAQSLCQSPSTKEYAEEIERLAANKMQLWNDILSTVTGAIQGDTLGPTERNALLLQAGRWYEEKLGRADLGMMALQQVLTTDPASEAAYEGLTNIYRRAEQWSELATVLLSRADVSGSSHRARDLRAEAADVYEQRLNDTAKAKELYGRVLAEDPAHEQACDGMASIAERTGDYQTLADILERQVESRRGRDQSDALIRVAEVYEDRLEDLGEATRRFEAVLAIDPHDLQALKGLDRIYNRTGKYRELLANLEHQVALAATPRQKIGLYERIAALYDEEFLDHEHAALTLEGILKIDPANDTAMTALARQYRVLDKWERLEKLYERHANVTGDDARRVEITLHRARVLAENLGAPDRAMQAYERVLELQPSQAGALEALVRLRERSGDAHAALAAIEALAAQAATPEARAEQWVRAARLLEGNGDKVGAIERYKLALEENPRDMAAAAALREAYIERGEADSLVALIEKELEHTDAKVARGRLYAELARIRREKLHDSDRAEVNAKTAIELDPTNADAVLVLGDIAFENERFVEASKYLESLVGRASALGKDDAVRMLVRYVEAYEKSTGARSSSPNREGRESVAPPAPSNPRLAVAVQSIEHIAPEDGDALARVARVVFDSGGDALGGAGDLRAPAHARGGDARPRGSLRRRVEIRRAASSHRRARQGRGPPPGRCGRRSFASRTAPCACPGVRDDGRLGGVRADQRASPRSRVGWREVRPAPRDRRRRVHEAERPREGDEDVRRRAGGAPRRPEAPDEADAALLGGEGLGEARRGGASPGGLRGGLEAARQVHAHGRHRQRETARRDEAGHHVLRARDRVRPDAGQAGRRAHRALRASE